MGKKATRADRAALLAASEGWKFGPESWCQKKKKLWGKWRHGRAIGHWANRATLLPSRTRGDGLDRSGPVLGPPPTPNSVFGPVLDRCTPLHKTASGLNGLVRVHLAHLSSRLTRVCGLDWHPARGPTSWIGRSNPIFATLIGDRSTGAVQKYYEINGYGIMEMISYSSYYLFSLIINNNNWFQIYECNTTHKFFASPMDLTSHCHRCLIPFIITSSSTVKTKT